MQHLKTPPFFLHCLANLLYSALRQSTKQGVLLSRLPCPGTRDTWSYPYVLFHTFGPDVKVQMKKSLICVHNTFIPFFVCHIVPNMRVHKIEKVLRSGYILDKSGLQK